MKLQRLVNLPTKTVALTITFASWRLTVIYNPSRQNVISQHAAPAR
jgi:hypothetical protein